MTSRDSFLNPRLKKKGYATHRERVKWQLHTVVVAHLVPSRSCSVILLQYIKRCGKKSVWEGVFQKSG